MSQVKRIANHLSKSPITQLIATYKYSCLRLSQRIIELEEKGFSINRRWADSINRDGNRVRYVVYSMAMTRANQRLFKSLYGANHAK